MEPHPRHYNTRSLHVPACTPTLVLLLPLDWSSAEIKSLCGPPASPALPWYAVGTQKVSAKMILTHRYIPTQLKELCYIYGSLSPMTQRLLLTTSAK